MSGMNRIKTRQEIAMHRKKAFIGALLIIAAAGCTKDRVYENIYEGMQNREQIVNPADDPIPPTQPSYDAYKRERAKALQQKSDNNLN
jgi:hypothetical protein